jgi:hypothetical protein
MSRDWPEWKLARGKGVLELNGHGNGQNHEPRGIQQHMRPQSRAQSGSSTGEKTTAMLSPERRRAWSS